MKRLDLISFIGVNSRFIENELYGSDFDLIEEELLSDKVIRKTYQYQNVVIGRSLIIDYNREEKGDFATSITIR